MLAERMSLYFQTYTLYSSVRPFALSAIIAGWDSPDVAEGGKVQPDRGMPRLYCIEPSGVYWVSRFRCVAVRVCGRVLIAAGYGRGTEGARLGRGGNSPRRRLRSSSWTR